MSIRVGNTIAGRYRIAGLHGVGSRSEVWQAFDGHRERMIALKVLRRPPVWWPQPNCSGSSPPPTDAASAPTIPTIPGAAHDNRVQVFDVGWTDGLEPYVAMELLEGDTLDATLDQGLPLRQRHGIATAILAGLGALHEAGLAHLWLCPREVLMHEGPEGRVPKLLGLGVPVPFRSDVACPFSGVDGYAAPEQSMRGAVVDARSDVYGAGVLLYEVLVGTRPAAIAQACDPRIAIGPFDPTDVDPAIGSATAAVIQRATRRAPDERFEDASAMVAAWRAGVSDGL